MERKPTAPFIKESTGNDTVLATAVQASLDFELDSGDLWEYIDLDRLAERGPKWLTELDLAPITVLERFNSPLLWEEIIKGYSGEPRDLVAQDLVSSYAKNSYELAGYEMKRRSTALTAAIPLFGLASATGKDMGEYMVNEAEISPVKRSALVAGKLLFVKPARTAEEYLERMHEIFPAEVVHDDSSAFDLMVRLGAFTTHGVNVCPAIGLTRKLFQEFGKQLDSGFDLKLIEAPVVDPVPQVR